MSKLASVSDDLSGACKVGIPSQRTSAVVDSVLVMVEKTGRDEVRRSGAGILNSGGLNWCGLNWCRLDNWGRCLNNWSWSWGSWGWLRSNNNRSWSNGRSRWRWWRWGGSGSWSERSWGSNWVDEDGVLDDDGSLLWSLSCRKLSRGNINGLGLDNNIPNDSLLEEVANWRCSDQGSTTKQGDEGGEMHVDGLDDRRC